MVQLTDCNWESFGQCSATIRGRDKGVKRTFMLIYKHINEERDRDRDRERDSDRERANETRGKLRCESINTQVRDAIKLKCSR